MAIAGEIREKIRGMREGKVFSLRDVSGEASNDVAAMVQLSRMVKAGELTRLSKGRFYKPRKSIYGELKPSEFEVCKDFLEKDGRTVGYLTGYSAYNAMGLTTQVSSRIEIGRAKARPPVRRGKYEILFSVQPNEILAEDVPLLRILDVLKDVSRVPDATPGEVVQRLRGLVRGLGQRQQERLVRLAMKYPARVRALTGAMLALEGTCDEDVSRLRESLNGVTRYKLPIGAGVLKNAKEWRIYETA